MSDGGVCRCKLRKRENDPHREGFEGCESAICFSPLDVDRR